MTSLGVKSRFSLNSRLTSLFVLIVFVFETICPSGRAWAQPQPLNLPSPSGMIQLTPAFVPPVLKGLVIHPDQPFHFDFVLDTGNTPAGQDLKEESDKLIKYFLASLTIPENDLWVNLSPNEKDRIIPNEFGQTEMGRDLLAEDYILKQLTASLLYPENDLGKEFWQKIYQTAQEKFGTTDVPMDSFHKIWIVPDKARVYENQQGVMVLDSKLKVLLEEDYLLRGNAQSLSEAKGTSTSTISNSILKEIIIPAIEKEVNEGKNFAQLRQIYSSLILAKWYKETLHESILNKAYADQKKTPGVDIDDKNEKEKIYAQYLEAFKKGVYDLVKEEYDPATQEVISRKYFSGGAQLRINLDRTSDSADLARFKPNGELKRIEGQYQNSDVQKVDAASLTYTPTRLQHHSTFDITKFDEETFDLKEMLTPSEIDELLNVLRLDKQSIKSVLLNPRRTAGFGFGFSVDMGGINQMPLIQEDFERTIEARRGKNQEITIYQIGLGSVFVETDEIFEMLQAAFASKGVSAQEQRQWKVNFIAVDVRSEFIEKFIKEFSVSVPFQLNLQAVQADTLDQMALKELGSLYKGDYIFNRYSGYANSFASTGGLYVKPGEKIGLNRLEIILNTYRSTKNILANLSVPGTRYILEPAIQKHPHSGDIFYLPGATVMTDNKGTGIYLIERPLEIGEKGIQSVAFNQSVTALGDQGDAASLTQERRQEIVDQLNLFMTGWLKENQNEFGLLTREKRVSLVDTLVRENRALFLELTSDFGNLDAYPGMPMIKLGGLNGQPTIWVLGWRKIQTSDGKIHYGRTEVHGHVNSTAVIHVLKGSLTQNHFLGNPHGIERAKFFFQEGQTVDIEAPYIHDVGYPGYPDEFENPEALTVERSILDYSASVHLYDPPLALMDLYKIVKHEDGSEELVYDGKWIDDEVEKELLAGIFYAYPSLEGIIQQDLEHFKTALSDVFIKMHVLGYKQDEILRRLDRVLRSASAEELNEPSVLIRNILEILKNEETGSVATSRVNVSQALNEFLRLFSDRTKLKIVRLDKNAIVEGSVDQGEILRLMQELVGNALTRGGEAEISLENLNGEIRFEVSNPGAIDYKGLRQIAQKAHDEKRLVVFEDGEIGIVRAPNAGHKLADIREIKDEALPLIYNLAQEIADGDAGQFGAPRKGIGRGLSFVHYVAVHKLGGTIDIKSSDAEDKTKVTIILPEFIGSLDAASLAAAVSEIPVITPEYVFDPRNKKAIQEMIDRGLTYKEAQAWREAKIKYNMYFPDGFFKRQQTAVNFILATLDTIEGFKAAREKNDIKAMAGLYRKEALNYEPKNKKRYTTKGQKGFWGEKSGLLGLLASSNRPAYLGQSKKYSVLLRLALPGLIDVRNPEALNPLEVEHAYWTDPENAKYHILLALDSNISGFKEARERKDWLEVKRLYVQNVVNYKSQGKADSRSGQAAFFIERGGLDVLMREPRPYLHKRNSGAALLRLVIPELFDPANPFVFKPNEVEDSPRRYAGSSKEEIEADVKDIERFFQKGETSPARISHILGKDRRTIWQRIYRNPWLFYHPNRRTKKEVLENRAAIKRMLDNAPATFQELVDGTGIHSVRVRFDLDYEKALGKHPNYLGTRAAKGEKNVKVLRGFGNDAEGDEQPVGNRAAFTSVPEDYALIYEAVGKYLSPQQQKVVELDLSTEMDEREIAVSLSIPELAVRSLRMEAWNIMERQLMAMQAEELAAVDAGLLVVLDGLTSVELFDQWTVKKQAQRKITDKLHDLLEAHIRVHRPDLVKDSLSNYVWRLIAEMDLERIQKVVPEASTFWQEAQADEYKSLEVQADELRKRLKASIKADPKSLRTMIQRLQKSDEDINDWLFDGLFNLGIISTEASLFSDGGRYSGRELQYQGTPYEMTREFLKEIGITSEDVLFDIGAGYGKVVLWAAEATDMKKVVGVEYMPQRAARIKKAIDDLKISNAQVINDDVLNVDLNEGTVFFLSNYFGDETLSRIADKLKAVARSKKIRIVTWTAPLISYFDNQTDWVQETKTLRFGNIQVAMYESTDAAELIEQNNISISTLEEIAGVYKSPQLHRQRIDISPFLGASALKRGIWRRSTPLPNGKPFGSQSSLFIGNDLSRIEMIPHFHKDRFLGMTFVGYKKVVEDGQAVEKEHEKSHWGWTGNKLIRQKPENMIKQLYSALDGKTVVDISEFLGERNLIRGSSRYSFPLPNDQTWEDAVSLHISQNLERIEMKLDVSGKNINGVYFYGHKNGRVRKSYFAWDGQKFFHINAGAEAIKALYDTSAGYGIFETDITDFLGDASLTEGYFRNSMPLPNGKTLGPKPSMRLGIELSKVIMSSYIVDGKVQGISLAGYKKVGGKHVWHRSSEWEWTGEEFEYREEEFWNNNRLLEKVKADAAGLAAKDWIQYNTARSILNTPAADHSKAIKLLIDLLDNAQDHELLWNVMAALSWHGGEEVIDPLIRFREELWPDRDQNFLLYERCIIVLGHLGKKYPDKIIPYLTRLVANGDDDERKKAVMALGHTRQPKAIPPLVGSLSDRNPYARKEAALSLKYMKAQAALPALKEAYQKESIVGIKSVLREVIDFLSASSSAEKPDAAELANVSQEAMDLVGGEKNYRYLDRLRQVINPNPDQKKTRALYIGSGADISTALLATDADEYVFVDAIPYFEKDSWKVFPDAKKKPDLYELVSYYLEQKSKTGWGEANVFGIWGSLRPFFEEELRVLDVDDIVIKVIDEAKKTFEISFVFRGKRRTVKIYNQEVKEDVEKVLVQEKPFDFWVMKALQSSYQQVQIDRVVNAFLLPDSYVIMDQVSDDNEIPFLKKNTLLVSVKDDELKLLEEKEGAGYGYFGDVFLKGRVTESDRGAYVYKKNPVSDAAELGNQQVTKEQIGEVLYSEINESFRAKPYVSFEDFPVRQHLSVDKDGNLVVHFHLGSSVHPDPASNGLQITVTRLSPQGEIEFKQGSLLGEVIIRNNTGLTFDFSDPLEEKFVRLADIRKDDKDWQQQVEWIEAQVKKLIVRNFQAILKGLEKSPEYILKESNSHSGIFRMADHFEATHEENVSAGVTFPAWEKVPSWNLTSVSDAAELQAEEVIKMSTREEVAGIYLSPQLHGKRIDISSWVGEYSLVDGSLKRSMPLPDGTTLGRVRPLFIGSDLVKLECIPYFHKTKFLGFTFIGYKKSEQQDKPEVVEYKRSYWSWINGKLIRQNPDKIIINLYNEKDPKLFADISSYLGKSNLRVGTIRALFPLPNGKTWGEDGKYLFLGMRLSSIKMSVDVKGGEIRGVRFYGYQMVEKKPGEFEEKKVDESYFAWSGEKFEYVNKDERVSLVESIKSLYSTSFPNAIYETDITKFLGDVSLKNGIFRLATPLPNGKTMGNQKSMRLGENLSKVTMKSYIKLGRVQGVALTGYKIIDGKEIEYNQSEWEWNGESFEYRDERLWNNTRWLKKVKKDASDAAALNEKDVGGIDLNPNQFKLDKEGVAPNVPLPLNFDETNPGQIQGLVPIIFTITPITNLPLLLGAKVSSEENQLSLAK